MTPLLAGRTAVVTGGARGIGLAIARTYVEHGARVVIGDLDEVGAEAAAKELGDAAIGVRCDVVSADDVQGLIDAAVATYGSLDVFVNNAGVLRDAPMQTMSEEDFDLVVQVNLKGTWNGTRLAAAHMRQHNSGAIVNISSLSGKVGVVGQTNYAAAKAGVVGLTKSAAKELAHHGIRVNTIQPGLIRSVMTEVLPQEAWDGKVAEIPMQRAGEAEEVAGVALFYASDLSSYMTGTVAEVTGGRFM